MRPGDRVDVEGTAFLALFARAGAEVLPPRYVALLLLRYGLAEGDAAPCTLEAVAAALGVTPGRAHRLEEQALARLVERSKRGPGLDTPPATPTPRR